MPKHNDHGLECGSSRKLFLELVPPARVSIMSNQGAVFQSDKSVMIFVGQRKHGV